MNAATAMQRVLSRRDQIFFDIDQSKAVGLEIGALDNPLIAGGTGKTYYADYCSTEQLKLNHANTPTVNTDKIVNVDFVTGDRRLADVVPSSIRFDYIVASHVAEHVPDIISWLQDLRTVLKPGGKVRLIIPNKERCFDLRRSLTEECDLVAAFVEKRTRPSPIQVYDFYRWHERDGRLVHTPQQSLHMAQMALTTYVDAHCWVFTPESFLIQISNLIAAGLSPFGLEFVTESAAGEIDFFVGLH
ncbi:MAG: class I SAM-dependent methyltransferase [Mesorhizobium sp.]|uniref:class I SAM-dependent methyltransferase n=1 Tax=Mesorhizobium sp. TaxID=1871066 RepID=UPI000FE99599|nr:class I SAM-dependent methyltransferase [Mesorhizobium sp.]RWC14053.1 MAG: class I SAM-dependent methyltransferase [Mesorhizobium sp.]